MKIEVRPIERKRWHEKRGAENFARPKKIQALVDAEKNEYATGLSDEDIRYLSQKMGVIYDLSPSFNQDKPHPFWDSSTAVIKLNNATMFFDTDNPLDFIRVKVMKASKYVANSQKEYDEGHFPDATHVIFDEVEEVDLKASKVAIKKRAIVECSKISIEKKVQIILVISGKDLKGRSDNFVEVELDKIIEKTPKEVLRLIEMNAEKLALHSLVLQALNKRIFKKQGHKILYQDSVLGQDVFDVIEYLQDVENQDLKLRVMSMV